MHLQAKLFCSNWVLIAVRICVYLSTFFHSLAELGDCDPLEHTLDLVTEFRFVPDQTEEVELAIFNAWKECRCALSVKR